MAECLRVDARGDLASSFCEGLMLVGDAAAAALELVFLSLGLDGILGIWPPRERCFCFIFDGEMTLSWLIEVGILPVK